MNKRIFASLLLTVFALGVSGCTKEQPSSSKAERKETKSAVSITEVAETDIEMENIKTTQPNPDNVIKEVDDGNDYSIGLLLTDWNTPISDIPEIDPSLDYMLEINKTTGHFDKSKINILTTDESGKMIYKKHTISNTISLYSSEEEKSKITQKIISEYDLPSEYTTQEYSRETNIQFGYIEKYDGEVSISFGNSSTTIVITNIK